MPANPRIFISYSRRDGLAAAAEIRGQLMAEGLSIWQDLVAMEGGRDWWQQIEEAISKSEYLLLLLTPRALESEVCKKEWRYARQQGTYVIPVSDGPPGRLDLEELTGWMRHAEIIDRTIPERWNWLVNQLGRPAVMRRVPFMAEPPPIGFVPRPVQFEQLRAALLGPATRGAVAITTALRGAGGYGKTTLARALCADTAIQDAFHDGVLWVTLGESPGDILGRVEDLIAIVSGNRPGFANIEAACVKLDELLAERRMLIVIDDVWNSADARPFLRGGAHCARLLTTRNSDTVPSGAVEQTLDRMERQEAIALLRSGLPASEDRSFLALATRLGEWPLLLKLANGALIDQVVRTKAPLADAIAYVGRLLDKRGLKAFDSHSPKERNQAAAMTLAVSVDRLNEAEQVRLGELAVFPEDVDVPVSAVELLWRETAGLDDVDTIDVLQRLFGLSLLLNLDLERRYLQLHDVVRSWLRDGLGHAGLGGIERSLIGAYHKRCGGEWHNLDDRYALAFLPMHLRSVDEKAWRKLLLDPRWMKCKLENSALGISSLLADYGAADQEDLRLIGDALRLSGQQLTREPRQLVAQLRARLLASKVEAHEQLLASAMHHLQHLCLSPIYASLDPPGGPLIETKQLPREHARVLSISADGRYWLSGWGDKQIRLFDIEKNQTVLTSEPFPSSVLYAALSCDGRYMLAACDPGRESELWLFDAWLQKRVFSTSIGIGISSVAICAEAESFAVGGRDGDLAVMSFDLVVRKSLSGSRASISAIAMDYSGTICVFATSDGIFAWDLQAGSVMPIADAAHRHVAALAVIPDRQGVVIASQTGYISVTGTDPLKAPEPLQISGAWVGALAVPKDGDTCFSASHDGTIRRWNQRKRVANLALKHESVVYGIDVATDGRGYASGSYQGDIRLADMTDGTLIASHHFRREELWRVFALGTDLKCLVYWGSGEFVIWDWSDGIAHSFKGKSGPSPAMAVTPCGSRCVRVHTGGQVDIWELASPSSPRILQIGNGYGVGRAVSPTARWAVTASRDARLMVWDVEQDREHASWLTPYGEPSDIALASDASRCALYFKERAVLTICDAGSGREIWTLRVTEDFGEPCAMTFTVDSRLLAVATHEGTVRLLDPDDRSIKGSFTADHRVMALCAASSSSVIAGDAGGNVHVLELLQPGLD